MIDRSYMLEKPAGPSPAKRYLDQIVVPFAMDVAGAGEVAVQNLSQRTGVRPAVLVGGMAGGVALLLVLAVRRGRRSAFAG
jgi:hypothetical protein